MADLLEPQLVTYLDVREHHETQRCAVRGNEETDVVYLRVDLGCGENKYSRLWILRKEMDDIFEEQNSRCICGPQWHILIKFANISMRENNLFQSFSKRSSSGEATWDSPPICQRHVPVQDKETKVSSLQTPRTQDQDYLNSSPLDDVTDVTVCQNHQTQGQFFPPGVCLDELSSQSNHCAVTQHILFILFRLCYIFNDHVLRPTAAPMVLFSFSCCTICRLCIICRIADLHIFLDLGISCTCYCKLVHIF